MERRAVRLSIRGRVQGVGYRWWAVGEARRLGVDGWVRNRRDGSVELVAAGSDRAVEAMIEACRHGPRAAEVTEVQVESTPEEPGSGFQERATV
jgi:acylphosphatase